MIEQERKFLLKPLTPLVNLVKGSPSRIDQGYLMLEQGKQLRVRIVNNSFAFLCFKSDITSSKRYEFEYEIPLEDAQHLWNISPARLIKWRYSVPMGNLVAEIDCYLNGFRVVEIEFKGKLENIPEFCGEEVTGNKKYSNINIAKLGISI